MIAKTVNQIIEEARTSFENHPRFANFCLICSFGLLGIAFKDEPGFVCTNSACRLLYSSKGYPLGIFKGASIAKGLPVIPMTNGNYDSYKAKIALQVEQSIAESFEDPTRVLMGIKKDLPQCTTECQGWLIIKMDDKFIHIDSESFDKEVTKITSHLEDLLALHQSGWMEANSAVVTDNRTGEKEEFAYILINKLDLEGIDFNKTNDLAEEIRSLGYEVFNCVELQELSPGFKWSVETKRSDFIRDQAVNSLLSSIFGRE